MIRIRSRNAEDVQPDEEALNDWMFFDWWIKKTCRVLREKGVRRCNIHVLMILNTFFLSLGIHSWSRIRPEDLGLLADKFKEIEGRRHMLMFLRQSYIDRGISDYYWMFYSDLYSEMVALKEQVFENYSKLLNSKPAGSVGYISRKTMDRFITALYAIVSDILKYSDDLDDDEKKAIQAFKVKLRFLLLFVQLTENDVTTTSVLNCIQDYICKVELALFRFICAEENPLKRRDDLLSSAPLLQRSINGGDEQCSILIILDVLKMSKKMLLGKGMAWRYKSGKVITKNMIWVYTTKWIYQILDDDFSRELLDYISSSTLHLECDIQRLHECLTFLPSSDGGMSDLSLEMRVWFIQAATFLGFLYAFSFGDLSEEEIGNLNLRLSALVTYFNLYKAEVSLKMLMRHDSSLIILMRAKLNDLGDDLKFMRHFFIDMKDGYTKDEVLLVSQSEAVVSDTLSFIEFLVQHEMEDDTCIEINLAFFKLLGTTKLIRAHMLALQLLYCHIGVAFQIEDQLVKLCNKLGFLVELMENFDQNNVNQYQGSISPFLV